uniref:Radical S-adenosyl methionine domain-containing protein 1, mitochondrial-like n=1 Tax=Saccoglossus kowalevskii TaxID=10224 RepID=A0ABM0M0A6_SACKO|nr:PREDICTED: radical S-adenosyl methionine domain-containing protein 1, mitochondrial-like [Saccoglossus kowalevskii]
MADMYEMAVETLKAAGFTRYEVSNFAKNVGAESVHNKNYWNGGQYIGVGPGAHGRFCRKNVNKREARIQTLEPEPWMREVENYGHATRKCTTQTKIDILEELLMVGLRTRHGIQDVRWRQFSEDVSLLKVFGDSLALEEFINNGLMKFDDKILRCSGKGISVVNSIVASLLQDLHNYQDLPSR